MLIFTEQDRTHYRSKPDVTADILNAVKDQPLGKTRIMNAAYMSNNQTREYLNELITKGLIS